MQELINDPDGPFDGIYLLAPFSMFALFCYFRTDKAVNFAVCSIVLAMLLMRTQRIPTLEITTATVGIRYITDTSTMLHVCSVELRRGLARRRCGFPRRHQADQSWLAPLTTDKGHAKWLS